MPLSAGEIQATLTLKDQMTAQMKAASQSSGQSLGTLTIALKTAQQSVTDYEKAIMSMADSTGNVTKAQQALIPGYDDALQRVQQLKSQLNDLSSAQDQSAASEEKATEITKEHAAALEKAGIATQDAKKGVADMGTQGTTTSAIFSGMTGVMSGFIGALSVERIASFVTGVVDAAFHLGNLSRATGIGTEDLQALDYVGTAAGVSVDQLASSISMMERRVMDGTPQAVKAIESLGLSIKDVQSLSPQEMFTEFVQRLAEIPDKAEQISLGTAVMGRSFRQISAMMTEDISKLMSDAKDSGAVAKDATIENLHNIETAWEQMWKQMKAQAAETINMVVLFFQNPALQANGGGPGGKTGQPIGGTDVNLPSNGKPAPLPNMQGFTVSLGENATAVSNNLAKYEAFQNRLQALKDQAVVPLTAANQAQIVSWHDLGMTNDELAGFFGVTAKRIEDVLKSQQKGAEFAQKYQTALANITDTLAEQGVTWDGSAEQAVKFGASVGDVALVLGKEKGEIVGLKIEMEYENEVAKRVNDEHWQNVESAKALTHEFSGLHDGLMIMAQTMGDVNLASSKLHPMNQILGEDFTTASMKAKLLNTQMGLMPDLTNQAALHMSKLSRDWTDSLDEMIQMVGKLGSVVGGTAGQMIHDFQSVLKAVSDLSHMGQKKDAQGNWVDMNDQEKKEQTTGMVMTGVVGGIGMGMNADTTQGFNHSMITGMGLDSAHIGQTIALGVATMGISVGVSAVVSGLKYLFRDRTLENIARDAGKDFGTTFSQATTDAIQAGIKSGLSYQASELMNLGSIITDAGGLTDANLPQMTQRLHDVFSMIETHQMTIAQGTKTIDDVWQQFAAAGTAADGRLSDSLKEIIALNERFGTQSKAIADYLKQQAGDAIDAFNAIVAGTADAVTGYDALKAAIDASNTAWDAAKANHDQAGMDKANKDNIAAMADQKQSAEEHKQELADLGVQAVASFAAAVAAGMSVTDAMNQMGPSLDTLIKSYQDLGLDVDDVALKNLLLQRQIQQGSPTLVAAVAGLSKEMIALDNMGLLNVDTFQAMERTGAQMYTRLQDQAQKAGGTTKDALIPMQDWLHEAADQATKLGIPLDDNTQMLIDQSKELGIWRDKGKSDTQIMNDSLMTLNDTMKQFIDYLSKIGPVDAPWANWTPPPTPPGGSTPPDDGGAQAAGSSGRVYRPTLFLAGEAGPEDFKFSGGHGSFNDETQATQLLYQEQLSVEFPGLQILDGSDLDSFIEKKALPRIVQVLEDHRRDFVPRLNRALNGSKTSS